MTRDAFQQILEATPDAWETRLIYADFLDDIGEHVLAAGQRWQAREKKCALIVPLSTGSLVKRYMWFDEPILGPTGNENISGKIFLQLAGEQIWFVYYETNADADTALAHAIHEVANAAAV